MSIVDLCYNLDAPENITIYGYENKQPIKVGTTVILTCVVTGGNPKANILWYKRDKKVILNKSFLEFLNFKRPSKENERMMVNVDVL